MEAYVNSRHRALNFQHVLSGHSVSYQNLFEPFHSWHITTITAATAHECEDIEPGLYRCVYSFATNAVFAPGMADYIKQKDPLQYGLLSGNIRVDRQADTFARDARGWYSPSMVKGYRDGLMEMTTRLQAIADSVPQTDWPAPWDL